MRLIDIEPYQKDGWILKTTEVGHDCGGINAVIKRIPLHAIPTVDAVPVVRCKDCKHYRYYGLTYDTVSECTIFRCENPDKDWFCADGEQKEGR